MQPFSRTFHTPGRTAQSQEIGYEWVDFQSTPVNVFASELSYCEPHWHRATELMIVLEGRFDILVEDQQSELTTGGMTYVSVDQLHVVHSAQRGSKILTLQLSPALLDDVAGIPPPRSVVVEGRDTLTQLGSEVQRKALTIAQSVLGGRGRRLALMSQLYDLLDHIQSLSTRGAPSDRQHIGASDHATRDLQIARQAIAWINTHYARDIRLDDVASELQTGYHHLSRVFNTVTGFTFREYLTLLRLNRAKSMLRDPATSITTIGASSGFTDHKQLNLAFQKYLHTTPTQYRKALLSHIPIDQNPDHTGVNRLLGIGESLRAIDSMLQPDA